MTKIRKNSKETPSHYHVATNFKLITIKTTPFLSFKDFSMFSKQQISWKEVGAAEHFFERAPPKQHPRKVWFNLSKTIQRFSNICSNNFQLFFTNRQKWKIFPKKWNLYYTIHYNQGWFWSEWVGDCCLTPIQQCSSYIMARTR